MSIFLKKVNLKLFYVIMVCLLLVIAWLLYKYYSTTDLKAITLLGGLTTGLIVAGLQLILEWTEHTEIQKYKNMGVKKILRYRDDEKYYKELIESANREIWVLGNTGSRFLIDFASKDRDDKNALLKAFSRNVKFKLLLPNRVYLATDEDKSKYDIAATRINELKKDYSGFFEYKYYNHAPYHSLVKVDDDCLVGPMFPDKPSKNSPAIHTYGNSAFAENYISYFEYEWENAK